MNLGLLGYGFMGASHLGAMEKLDGVTLRALATRTRPSADKTPKGNLDLKIGTIPEHVHWHSDWREVLRDEEIDAIDICLPSNMHKEVILEAFQYGKHVLCEKPMAMTPEDCDEILESASRSNCTFMVAHVVRFMAPYRYAGDFVRSVGRDVLTSCTFRRSTGYPKWGGWLSNEEASGGAILDLLSHDLDIALSIFGEPYEVSGISHGEVDTLQATLRYGGVADIIVEGGWYQPETTFSQSFDIRTKDGALSFHDNQLLLERDGVRESISLPENDPYFDEIAYFIDCCRRGIEPQQCTPQSSADAVKLATLLKESRTQKGKTLPWQM